MNQGEGPRSKARPCIDSSRPMLTSVAYVCRRLTGHETRMSLKGFDGFQFLPQNKLVRNVKNQMFMFGVFFAHKKISIEGRCFPLQNTDVQTCNGNVFFCVCKFELF